MFLQNLHVKKFPEFKFYKKLFSDEFAWSREIFPNNLMQLRTHEWISRNTFKWNNAFSSKTSTSGSFGSLVRWNKTHAMRCDTFLILWRVKKILIRSENFVFPFFCILNIFAILIVRFNLESRYGVFFLIKYSEKIFFAYIFIQFRNRHSFLPNLVFRPGDRCPINEAKTCPTFRARVKKKTGILKHPNDTNFEMNFSIFVT